MPHQSMSDAFIRINNAFIYTINDLNNGGMALFIATIAASSENKKPADEAVFISKDAFHRALPGYDRKSIAQTLTRAVENLREARITDAIDNQYQPLVGEPLVSECDVRRNGAGHVEGVVVRFGRKTALFSGAFAQHTDNTIVPFKCISRLISTGRRVANLYLYLVSQQGTSNKREGYSARIELDDLKRITKTPTVSYKIYRKQHLKPMLNLINTYTDLFVLCKRIDTYKNAIKFSFTISDKSKPTRPQLEKRPLSVNDHAQLVEWARHNTRLLLNHQAELKAYDPDLDLLVDDKKRLAQYDEIINRATDQGTTKPATEEVSTPMFRPIEVEEVKQPADVNVQFAGIPVAHLLGAYKLLDMDRAEFLEYGHQYRIQPAQIHVLLSDPEAYAAIGVPVPAVTSDVANNLFAAFLAQA